MADFRAAKGIGAVLLCAVFALSSCSVGKKRTLGGRNVIPENGVVGSEVFKTIKNDNSTTVFYGDSNGIEYEWTVFGSDLKDVKNVDISLFLETEPDGSIYVRFNSDEDFGFSPLLSVRTEKKSDISQAVLYKKDGENYDLVKNVSVTGNEKTVFNVTFPETFGEYMIAARAPESEVPTENEADKSTLSCVMSIECTAVFDDLTELDESKLDILPSDGVFLSAETFDFEDGETVYDLLARVCKEKKIHLETSKTPATGGIYIEGMGNLYENDCGSLSGWVYSVNGEFPNYSCGQYTLNAGDVVEWRYTCDLGKDVGNGRF